MQSTYQLGSIPIDRIFISQSLEISIGGYLPFGTAPSNYRALWIKVKVDLAFGYVFQKSMPLIVRRLKYEDPVIVKRFQDEYLQFLTKYNLFE